MNSRRNFPAKIISEPDKVKRSKNSKFVDYFKLLIITEKKGEVGVDFKWEAFGSDMRRANVGDIVQDISIKGRNHIVQRQPSNTRKPNNQESQKPNKGYRKKHKIQSQITQGSKGYN